MNFLLEKIGQSIRARRLFCRGQRILVAVSGGLDSMVLFHLMYELSLKNGWQLTIGHFNHQLRGRSSDADEKLVRKAASNLKLRFVSERADAGQFAKVNRLSIEMAARKLRHEFFARTAHRLEIKSIALAHHADDQVELFFLRLFRGAGTEGLAGMKWKSPSPVDSSIQLVRPLLDQPKEVLNGCAKLAKIRFREDESNATLDFQRNRIRHELIPLLKKNYQPALARTTLRVIEILGAEAEFVSSASRDWLRRKTRPDFAKLPVAVQRRCVQEQLLKLKLLPEFELIESLRVESGRWISVNSSSSVSRDATGLVRLQKREASDFKPTPARKFSLSEEEGHVVFDGLKIDWTVFEQKGNRVIHEGNGEFFDAGKIGRTIVLRYWKPGDRFQPIGMKSVVKLQDLFTNLKVSRSERHQRIVATTGQGEIFWVEAMRISERFKLDKQSVHRLKWKWQRLEPLVAT